MWASLIRIRHAVRCAIFQVTSKAKKDDLMISRRTLHAIIEDLDKDQKIFYEQGKIWRRAED